MHKDNPVLLAEFDPETNTFSKILEVFSHSHVPFASFQNQGNIIPKTKLTDWYNHRSIPGYRIDIDKLCDSLGISNTKELLSHTFALSISDHYWLKPEGLDISWNTINFFDNNFNSELSQKLILENKKISIDELGETPVNTTDGYHKKVWIKDQYGTPVLLKSGSKPFCLEPINERLASDLCFVLDFPHVKYDIVNPEKYDIGDSSDPFLLSSCDAFTTRDTEFLTAYDILNFYDNKPNSINVRDFFEEKCKDNNIFDISDKLDQMIIIDSLILNEDRHLRNFGIIRDANSLEWLDFAPIFDSGTSMLCLEPDSRLHSAVPRAKYFNNTNKSFTDLVKEIKNPNLFNSDKVVPIVDIYTNLLKEYQPETGISDQRISSLRSILSERINLLERELKQREPTLGGGLF